MTVALVESAGVYCSRCERETVPCLISGRCLWCGAQLVPTTAELASAEAGSSPSSASAVASPDGLESSIEGGTMENQHEQIRGYRDLNEDEIALMNEVKATGDELGELVERLLTRDKDDVDARWVNIGRTHLQQGVMALVRAIAQPTSF